MGMHVKKMATKPINKTGEKSKLNELKKEDVVKNDVRNITYVKM
jgi:hypothetical protein